MDRLATLTAVNRMLRADLAATTVTMLTLARAAHQTATRAPGHTVEDMLTVLARWGADLDHGNPASVLEVALRDAATAGARSACPFCTSQRTLQVVA